MYFVVYIFSVVNAYMSENVLWKHAHYFRIIVILIINKGINQNDYMVHSLQSMEKKLTLQLIFFFYLFLPEPKKASLIFFQVIARSCDRDFCT